MENVPPMHASACQSCSDGHGQCGSDLSHQLRADRTVYAMRKSLRNEPSNADFVDEDLREENE